MSAKRDRGWLALSMARRPKTAILLCQSSDSWPVVRFVWRIDAPRTRQPTVRGSINIIIISITINIIIMMRQTAMAVPLLVVLAAAAALLSKRSHAFAPALSLPTDRVVMAESATALPAYATNSRSNSSNKQASSSSNNNNNEKASFWLKDFCIASGEIIDPYAVLKVPRKADGGAIRKSYIEQSRRYHPDGARHRKFLPGSCNSIEEVREQWERIKLAYEILYVLLRRFSF
jgi:hypothetical protein